GKARPWYLSRSFGALSRSLTCTMAAERPASSSARAVSLSQLIPSPESTKKVAFFILKPPLPMRFKLADRGDQDRAFPAALQLSTLVDLAYSKEGAVHQPRFKLPCLGGVHAHQEGGVALPKGLDGGR